MAVRPLKLSSLPRFRFRASWWVTVAALVVGAAMLLPAAYLVLRTSQEWGQSWDVLSRPRSVDAMIRTLWLALTVAAGAVAIAVPAAWLTTRTDMPGRRIWLVLLTLPLAIPSYIGAFLLVSALGPRGMFQDLLEPLGVESVPEIYGFRGAWLALTLFTYPYVLLPVRAALQGADRSLEEASRSLGKSALTTFFRVTLPQLRPAIAAGGLLAALYTLSDFGAVSILRFDTLSRLIHLEYEGSLNRHSAAAVSLLLVMIALIVVTLESATRGRSRYHTEKVGRTPRPVRLGRWKWPAMAFCATVLLVALVVPLTVLGYWLVRGLSNGESVGSVVDPAIGSVYVSAIAAAVTVVAALPVAFLAARKPGPLSWVLEKVSVTGFALPGIVVAIALVFFAANYAPEIYQTIPLLAFAYVVLFLPQALWTCRAAFLGINPKTEEAARGLGGNPVKVFWKVTLPQLLPGMSAASALVFLTAMKELPATLLLSPPGFDALPAKVWASSTEGFFAASALPALAIILLSSVPLVWMVLRERRLV